MSIPVTVYEQTASTAASYFHRTSHPAHLKPESNLLKSIRIALRGYDSRSAPSRNTATFIVDDDPEQEQEITWDDNTVVLSISGVIRKKWNFQAEGQPIHWACIAWLEQYPPYVKPPVAPTSKLLTKESPGRPTFGPFAQPYEEPEQEAEESTRVSAVFVFFRSIARVFALNGLQYVFALPFLVRRAWPITPYGVMMQRLLEPGEVEEAELTGDGVLPTIFCITNSFAETTAVGLASGIVGPGRDKGPARLLDQEASKPLKSIDHTETIIYVSHKCPSAGDELFVTVDSVKKRLSVWRYAYIKPRDAPVSLSRPPEDDNPSQKQPTDPSSTFPPPSPGSLPATQDRDVPLSSLPSMPPSLSTTTTMASIVSQLEASQQPPDSTAPAPAPQTESQPASQAKVRKNSLTRNDLSLTMDRMVLGGRLDADPSIDQGKMRTVVWMESLYVQDIGEADARCAGNISVALFDSRWDGKSDRSLLSICLPAAQSLVVLSVHMGKDKRIHLNRLTETTAISATAIRATRRNVWDLLILRSPHQAFLLTHGIYELPVQFNIHRAGDETRMEVDLPISDARSFMALEAGCYSRLMLKADNGQLFSTSIDLMPKDPFALQVLQMLANSLPAEPIFQLHQSFLKFWTAGGRRSSGGAEFDCLVSAVITTFNLEDPLPAEHDRSPSAEMLLSESRRRLREDPVLRYLKKTVNCLPPIAPLPQKRHSLLAPLLFALHSLGENLRLTVEGHSSLLRLVPLICKVARAIRPEWSDYWRRICPGLPSDWSLGHPGGQFDDRLPAWPPDVYAILHAKIGYPESKAPFHDASQSALRFNISSLSFAYGRVDPLRYLNRLNAAYKCLADDRASTQKRAEKTIYLMVASGMDAEFVDRLPLSLAAPLRESARTCQLAPPSDWPLSGYHAIGRDDVATSAYHAPDMLLKDGYRTIKDFIIPIGSRRTIQEIGVEARTYGLGDNSGITGVELDLDDFTDIRFGQDRRLEEVARMLCSSTIPSVKAVDRPELSEHDQAKEQQLQVLRIAERTLALPYGRAMFTYGSIPLVTRESYRIPKLEYTVRLQPLNIMMSPEPGKIALEALSWGEFHNGVAAGLRISPYAAGVESSWIAFNKPSELTPEHAGFLYGLGLTGHLKQLMTWHTFGYLTPKHDWTSIGVLLGLAAAHIGSSNYEVSKVLAVHTPALLPTKGVDLNVSLVIQAAGMSAIGILYLGSGYRRMAEMCLSQISRRDMVQPDISNEYREAYTLSAALAFGMIMLGKGSNIPADAHFLERITTLIRGDSSTLLNGGREPFDVSLTSPAGTIALGLMYLRTERRDVANILTVPDTVIALNRIPPTLLLLRTLSRALIMWNAVAPTPEWLGTQLPESIKVAIEARFKGGAIIDDAMELAYYNIVPACCFAIGLKFAGTARQEAYKMIIRYYDLFNRLLYTSGPTFDHRIKRSAVRDGLNLISIALSMVMAGTGEITCLRRIRTAYGMYTQAVFHPPFKYGVHVATHLSLGLLFLGGGRFTLGTSDAAVACLVTAFFPRFHGASGENKSYLQALRHLWVLAVEPRCLMARDVDSKEVVYLPLKIGLKNEGVTQLVSPTLIPDLNNILSIRVDTPRYWPFHLDMEHIPHHRNNLLRSQTLYVKRRSAFLSYTEDPRGSRSLFVRSRSSAGEAATLDFPQVSITKTHPAGDLSEFITSFSNDALFLAFADHFARNTGQTEEELLFQAYCHAALFDSILQGKPQSIQSCLTLFRYRITSQDSQYFQLRLQDLRNLSEFYGVGKLYDRRFSGRSENNYRVPLIRDTTVLGVLHALDQRLDSGRSDPAFVYILRQYANGKSLSALDERVERYLAWYLVRSGVPSATVLVILRDLARDAHAQCIAAPPPAGSPDPNLLNLGIKEVIHATATKMTMASGWAMRSLDEIVQAWGSET